MARGTRAHHARPPPHPPLPLARRRNAHADPGRVATITDPRAGSTRPRRPAVVVSWRVAGRRPCTSRPMQRSVRLRRAWSRRSTPLRTRRRRMRITAAASRVSARARMHWAPVGPCRRAGPPELADRPSSPGRSRNARSSDRARCRRASGRRSASNTGPRVMLTSPPSRPRITPQRSKEALFRHGLGPEPHYYPDHLSTSSIYTTAF